MNHLARSVRFLGVTRAVVAKSREVALQLGTESSGASSLVARRFLCALASGGKSGKALTTRTALQDHREGSSSSRPSGRCVSASASAYVSPYCFSSSSSSSVSPSSSPMAAATASSSEKVALAKPSAAASTMTPSARHSSSYCNSSSSSPTTITSASNVGNGVSLSRPTPWSAPAQERELVEDLCAHLDPSMCDAYIPVTQASRLRVSPRAFRVSSSCSGGGHIAIGAPPDAATLL